jgi:hypothetical protein
VLECPIILLLPGDDLAISLNITKPGATSLIFPGGNRFVCTLFDSFTIRILVSNVKGPCPIRSNGFLSKTSRRRKASGIYSFAMHDTDEVQIEMTSLDDVARAASPLRILVAGPSPEFDCQLTARKP